MVGWEFVSNGKEAEDGAASIVDQQNGQGGIGFACRSQQLMIAVCMKKHVPARYAQKMKRRPNGILTTTVQVFSLLLQGNSVRFSSA